MSLITTIDGIPLYTTVQEALAWARSNNATGYHTHTYIGQFEQYTEITGYMGAHDHAQAVGGSSNTTTTTTTTTNTNNTSMGGGTY